MTRARMHEVMFTGTPLGQLIYDLGFTTLSDSYLARKYRNPVKVIRKLRTLVYYALQSGALRRGKRKPRRD